MENNVVISNVPGTEPTPIEATPAPAPAPAPVPAPVQTAPVVPTQSFSQGGSAGNPVKQFFADVSFTDVGIIILATVAFGYTIYHYREQIKKKKKEQSAITNRLDEIEANVKAALGPNYKSM